MRLSSREFSGRRPMSADRIGIVANATHAVEVQRAMKKQEKQSQEPFRGDVVSLGKSEALRAVQIEWPPFLPIGHTQGIYQTGE